MYNIIMDQRLLQSCVLCGHRCGVNRLDGQLGKCRAGSNISVASFCVHHGEEPMISGRRGSGTIFFANCCLKCAYCQNYEISQLDKGKELGTPRFLSGQAEELGKMMLELQARGVHNINLVSPTHYAPQIIGGPGFSPRRRLKLPVVYNTGGYDSMDLLKELRRENRCLFARFKYFDEKRRLKYSGAGNYPEPPGRGSPKCSGRSGISRLTNRA